MRLIDADILTEIQGLTVGWKAGGLALGLVLWLTGWRWHRFWIVLGLTTTAGLLGLAYAGKAGDIETRDLVVPALLLALSVGLLALELARVLAFLAGGTAACLAARSVLPDLQAMAVLFLAGGLTALLLYRFWMVALTSFLGTLIVWHCGLVLIGDFTNKPILEWAETRGPQLNAGVIAAAVVGLLLQMRQARAGGAEPSFTFASLASPRRWLVGLRGLLRR